jgi:hypothetical protein
MMILHQVMEASMYRRTALTILGMRGIVARSSKLAAESNSLRRGTTIFEKIGGRREKVLARIARGV